MRSSADKIGSFFYKYWWVYYLLFFLLIGLMVYSCFLNWKSNNLDDRINLLDRKITECCRKIETNQRATDSIRVREYNGNFGCLSFTLVWDSTDDLDLHVIDADKNHIYFKKYCKSFDGSFSSAGGQLDIDLNAEGIDTDKPVENVYFKCAPPNGNYIVKAHLYDKRTLNPVMLKLTIRQNGNIVEEIEKTVENQNEFVEIVNFRYAQN